MVGSFQEVRCYLEAQEGFQLVEDEAAD